MSWLVYVKERWSISTTASVSTVCMILVLFMESILASDFSFVHGNRQSILIPSKLTTSSLYVFVTLPRSVSEILVHLAGEIIMFAGNCIRPSTCFFVPFLLLCTYRIVRLPCKCDGCREDERTAVHSMDIGHHYDINKLMFNIVRSVL